MNVTLYAASIFDDPTRREAPLITDRWTPVPGLLDAPNESTWDIKTVKRACTPKAFGLDPASAGTVGPLGRPASVGFG